MTWLADICRASAARPPTADPAHVGIVISSSSHGCFTTRCHPRDGRGRSRPLRRCTSPNRPRRPRTCSPSPSRAAWAVGNRGGSQRRAVARAVARERDAAGRLPTLIQVADWEVFLASDGAERHTRRGGRSDLRHRGAHQRSAMVGVLDIWRSPPSSLMMSDC